MRVEVVCVLFSDDLGLRRYLNRRILHGTLPEQVDQAEEFLKRHMRVGARTEGFHRVDEPDYSLEALREAVVNAVVHRDYSLAGEAVRIFYYPDRIEMHRPDLLLPGIRLAETLPTVTTTNAAYRLPHPLRALASRPSNNRVAIDGPRGAIRVRVGDRRAILLHSSLTTKGRGNTYASQGHPGM